MSRGERRGAILLGVGVVAAIALAAVARESTNYSLAPEGMVSGTPRSSSANYTLDGGFAPYGGLGESTNLSASYNYVGQLVEFDPCPEFAAWQIANFGSVDAPEADITADADQDGVTNVEEFLFNMDPTTADSSTVAPGSSQSGLPHVVVADVDGSDKLTIEFVRRKDCGTYEIEASSDLAAWTPSSATQVGTPTSINADYERVVFADSAPVEPAARRLLRMRVSLP